MKLSRRKWFSALGLSAAGLAARPAPALSVGTGLSYSGTTLSIQSMFSDPAAIGRSIDEAFTKYRTQTGRNIGRKD